MKFITFIGNRNIDYHNKSLDKDYSLNENKNNQKDMAKAILEDYEREKEFIEEKFISFFLLLYCYDFLLSSSSSCK